MKYLSAQFASRAQATRSRILLLIGSCTAIVLSSSGLAIAEEAIINDKMPADIQLRPLTLTLIDAIKIADKNYPAIRAALYHEQAASAGIQKARTAYLPKGNLLVQETRATSNNITGPIFPNLTILNISGGVKGTKNDMSGGWGSAFGTLVSWEPFDFGLRRARVEVARSQTKEANAQVAVTKLDVESAAADSFLRTLAAHQAVLAAQAKLKRLTVFVETVHVLAGQDLRPTTDEYLAQAEQAKAQDEVTDAEQAYELSVAALCRAIGVSNTTLNLESGSLLVKEPDTTVSPLSILNHPIALTQAAVVETAHARKKVIEKTYYPQFNLLGALFARGSSYRTDISINNSIGYYPSKFNYAVGLGITFPYLDIFELRAEHKIADRLEQEQRAFYDLTLLNLEAQNAEARALIKAAIKVAANTPARVKAATEAERSVRIRYQHGLATVNDVAQDEELLTRAQVDYATAQLRVWRALLAAAVAQGNIKPLIDQVLTFNDSWRR